MNKGDKMIFNYFHTNGLIYMKACDFMSRIGLGRGNVKNNFLRCFGTDKPLSQARLKDRGREVRTYYILADDILNLELLPNFPAHILEKLHKVKEQIKADLEYFAKTKMQTSDISKYKEPIKADDDIKDNDDLKAEIESLKTEISQIKKALEYLGIECKNGVFIIKEQPEKKFFGLF